jgi:hypothetical protein
MDQARMPGPLLSIHMTSNRPENFAGFLDRLQQATADISSVEVVIKVDDTDAAMNELVQREAQRRPFSIKYLSTPLVGGFFGLWRSYDDLLRAADPNAYFVIGLNDEMYFKTRAWDRVLGKYVGLHPDHIFRLRTSVHRYRNYYDYWEPGFANDTSAFMTRRWLEVGGGWCPCNGPDTFQQCVAYYFGWLDRFNNNQPYRDRGIDDIEFGGHGASTGLGGYALRRRIGGSLDSHFILVSHAMQEEAARRAQKLRAQIWLDSEGSANLRAYDNRKARRVEVVDTTSNRRHRTFPYRLNPVRIGMTNAVRKLNCGYFLAGGSSNRLNWIENFLNYLAFRNAALDFWFEPVGNTIPSRTLRIVRQVVRLMVKILSIPGRVYAIFKDASVPAAAGHSRAYYVAHTTIRSTIFIPLQWLGIRPRDSAKPPTRE